MMQFFTDLFGPVIAYLLLVLLVVAIAVAVWFAYKTIARPRMASNKRNRQTRLGITDVALVDKHRRLVLLRRDDVEHLIMIGGHSDLVIESDIRRNAPARPLSTPEKMPAAAVQPQKTAEAAKKAPAPEQPAAPPQKPAPTSTAPLKLKEETPQPRSEPTPVPERSTATVTPLNSEKVGSAAGAVAAVAGSAAASAQDLVPERKSSLAMPGDTPTQARKEEHPPSPKLEDDNSNTAHAMREMDELLEELAVPKK